MFTQQERVRLVAGTGGVVVVAALLVAMVASVSAQGPGPGRGDRGRAGVLGGPGGPGGPRGDGSGIGASLRRLSSLTDAQRQQLRELAGQRREELATSLRQLADARRALAASAETGQVDESKAVELGAAVSALALGRARAQAEALAVLTPDQRAELAKRRDQMRQWLEARPGGGDGRRRGGRPAGL